MTLAELIPSLRSSLPHPLESWLRPSSTHHIPGGDLSVGGAGLVGVAAQYGTPAYVLDLAGFRARCATYRQAFHGADVAYAGKALQNRARGPHRRRRGPEPGRMLGRRAGPGRRRAVPGHRIVLHGNAKPASLLRRALPMGGRILVDSLDEIATFAAVAFGAGRQRMLLRVTPDLDAHTRKAITTGTDDQKLGLSITSGAAAHAIAYHPGDVPLGVGDLAAALRRSVKEACATDRLSVPRLTVEPGRAVAGPSGITVYRVLAVEQTLTRTWPSMAG